MSVPGRSPPLRPSSPGPTIQSPTRARLADRQCRARTWLTAIANGDGIAPAPESAVRYYARPGITYRPVTGVSPSQAGVAWRPAHDANPAVQDFVRCCLDNKQIS